MWEEETSIRGPVNSVYAPGLFSLHFCHQQTALPFSPCRITSKCDNQNLDGFPAVFILWNLLLIFLQTYMNLPLKFSCKQDENYTIYMLLYPLYTSNSFAKPEVYAWLIISFKVIFLKQKLYLQAWMDSYF